MENNDNNKMIDWTKDQYITMIPANTLKEGDVIEIGFKPTNMSEHKTPLEQIQELDYEYDKLLTEMCEIIKKTKQLEGKLLQLKERRKSLLNYLNHDSINQDKTE